MLDAQVGLSATLLSVVDELQDLLVGHLLDWVSIRVYFLRNLVLNTPELTVGVELADSCPDTALLVNHRAIELFAVLGATLKDVAVVLEVLLVDLDDDLGGSEHAPGVVDAALVVLEGSDVVLATLSRVLGLGRHFDAVLGDAAVALARVPEDNALAPFSDQFRDFLVGHGALRSPNDINYLTSDFTEAWGTSPS